MSWRALTVDPILAAAGLSARARVLTELMTLNRLVSSSEWRVFLLRSCPGSITIERDFPAWQPADRVCSRCAEVYACREAP